MKDFWVQIWYTLRMTIEWNKVTWYSKIAAVAVFVGTFFLGFWLGTMKAEKVYVEVPQIIHNTKNIPTIPVTSNVYHSDQYGFEINLEGYIVDSSRRGLFVIKEPEANFLVYDPQKEPGTELHGGTEVHTYDGVNIAIYGQADSENLKNEIQLEVDRWKDNPEVFQTKSVSKNGKTINIYKLSSLVGPYFLAYMEGTKYVYVLTTREYDIAAFLNAFSIIE